MDARSLTQWMFDHLERQHGPTWIGSRQPGAQKPSREELRAWRFGDPARVLRAYQLKSIGRDAQSGWLAWLEDTYPLDVYNHMPSPRVMLDVQCEGRRIVSALLTLEFNRPIGRHAGPVAFLLHDLEHAHKFFGNPELTRAQIAFFRRLRTLTLAPVPWPSDAQFEAELDYVMADMNSHPLHMFKYLKAILLNLCKRLATRKPASPLTRILSLRAGVGAARLQRPRAPSTSPVAKRPRCRPASRAIFLTRVATGRLFSPR